MQGTCEGVEHHLWSSDSRPASRGIRALRSSKPVPQCTAVRAQGGGLLTEESKVKARWAGYFEWLYQADPPAVELEVRGITIPLADPPINCDPPPLVETHAAVNRWTLGKAPGICGMHAELLKAGGNAVLMLLHYMQFCALPGTQASSQLTGRGALLFLPGKGRVITSTVKTIEG